ncbi:DNA polymerase IV [Veillonella montpellierensis]|uniref:DNA polymerase IV n=1 Tax=Veillonella montpellierensis TaxID=187328 RepID=UPI0023F75666|nr:DNA polymerase IV [Veillonella montpellierensis]
MRRWIMHVDMDAFYASVEQLDHPEYRGRPVIVGGLSARGVVATASYEARAFGVTSAMGAMKAHQLCPEGIFVPPRMERYHQVSQQIHEIMAQYTPYIEPLSLDEAFLEVSGMGHMFKGPYELGKDIKARVLQETGLVISAGIAPNKLLAKIASDIDKPNGLVIVPYGKEIDFLKDLPISRLWGVGKHTEKRLHEGGFYKLGDIQRLPDERPLIPYCGTMAKRFYDMSRGIDDRPVEYERRVQSVGNEETYEMDLSDPELIDCEWRYFSHRVARRLRKQHVMGQTVSIKVRYHDFVTLTRQKTLHTATDSEYVLYEVARRLYDKIDSHKPIRLLGLSVSQLCEPIVQTSLFATEVAQEALTETLDDLADRFGEQAVMRGDLWQRKAHTVRQVEADQVGTENTVEVERNK